ncbi:hypothetical protein D3C71_2026860 [compost metagenome]
MIRYTPAIHWIRYSTITLTVSVYSNVKLGLPTFGAIALSIAILVRKGTVSFVTVPRIIRAETSGSICFA